MIRKLPIIDSSHSSFSGDDNISRVMLLLFLLPLLSRPLLLLLLPLLAAPDYSGLNQAVTNYFTALDIIARKLPTADTAARAAELIDEWSLANEIFAHAGEQFVTKNPELLDLPARPPGFIAAFGRLSRLKLDYPTLPAGVSELIKRFHDDPEVARAFARFQKSLVRVQLAGSPPKK